MIEDQNNSCYICKEIFTKRAVVDHCHSSGSVRKLLCGSCNTALGHAKEDISILEKMIMYLEEHGT